jgi:L-threonylcarbamoyladenylate synthase
MHTDLLPTSTAEELERAKLRAVETLGRGEPVALPTETVYGLAADTLNPDAVLKIFEAKERPFFDPLICHLPDTGWLERMSRIPDDCRRLVHVLVDRFWPGPLTLVLRKQEIVPDVVTSGLETVALRMSAHPVFQKIVEALGRPLSAPSANRFGRISPTAASHVMTELGGRIPLIVDGGATAHGIESTIVAIERGMLRLLRAGPITPEQLCDAWIEAGETTPSDAEVSHFHANLRSGIGAPDSKGSAVQAPGQMKSHYAPRTPLRFIADDAPQTAARTGLLAFQKAPAASSYAVTEILSPSGDLREAAANLFASLRRLDEAGLELILAEPVPEQGLGIAIMDRLRKAAVGSQEPARAKL